MRFYCVCHLPATDLIFSFFFVPSVAATHTSLLFLQFIKPVPTSGSCFFSSRNAPPLPRFCFGLLLQNFKVSAQISPPAMSVLCMAPRELLLCSSVLSFVLDRALVTISSNLIHFCLYLFFVSSTRKKFPGWGDYACQVCSPASIT